jgi:hypothetical protein
LLKILGRVTNIPAGMLNDQYAVLNYSLFSIGAIRQIIHHKSLDLAWPAC